MNRTPIESRAEELVPLSPPVYQILITLGTGRLHGYGIIREFEDRTGQVGALLPGSLYNTIARMEKLELLEEAPAPDSAGEAADRRRYYRATALGIAVAKAESRRLRALLDLAEDRQLGGSGSATPDLPR